MEVLELAQQVSEISSKSLVTENEMSHIKTDVSSNKSKINGLNCRGVEKDLNRAKQDISLLKSTFVSEERPRRELELRVKALETTVISGNGKESLKTTTEILKLEVARLDREIKGLKDANKQK